MKLCQKKEEGKSDFKKQELVKLPLLRNDMVFYVKILKNSYKQLELINDFGKVAE